jgi:Xaa-Pro aminopeptidase
LQPHAAHHHHIPGRFGGVLYFGFDALTLVPIQTTMVDASLLSAEEVAWLDGYHAKVGRA